MIGDQKANNKRIAKNTLYLFFRSVVILGVYLYTSRVVLDTLGVEDYGIYNVVGGIVTMFTMISGTLASASQRFITYALGESDPSKVKRVFNTSVTLHFVIATAIVVILEVVGIWMLNNKINLPPERLAAAHWVLQFSIITLFVNVISVPYNALITAHERMSAFAYISLIDGFLKLGAALYLYVCGFDKLIVHGLLLMLIVIILRSIYTLYCKKHFEEARNIKFKIEKGIFGEMFAFAGWNLLGNGSMVLRNQGVDILLNMFYGVTVNAAKGLANQIQHAITMLVGNFQIAVKPQLTKAVAQNDKNRVEFLVSQGSRFSFYILMLIAVPVMNSAYGFLSLWLKEVPEYTVPFLQWTMIYLLLDSQSRFHIHAILSTGKIRNYQIIVGGTKLLAVPLAFLFLKFGAPAIIGIWVNIGLEVFCFVERLYYNSKQIDYPSLQFVKKIFIPNWTTFIIAYIPSYFFGIYISSNIFICVPISVGATCLIILFVGLKNNERHKVFSKLEFVVKNKILKK